MEEKWGFSWVPTSGKTIPPNALVAGHDKHSKQNVYIGRGHAPQQGLVPGKVISFWNGFFYPLFGVEHHLDKDFDVLCSKTPEKFKWVAAKGFQVPKDAVEGGITHDGLPLFVARGKAPDGALCAGKLHPPFVFVLSWGGKEHIVSDYEVLVLPGYTEKHKIDKQSIPKGKEFAWVVTTESNIPVNALPAGRDNFSQEQSYIGRGYDSPGELVPGKVSSFWKGFFYPMNGAERHHTKHEILVTDNPGRFKWEATTGSKVPTDAVVGGKTSDGTSLYVARAKAPDGALTSGKLHPKLGCLISWGGKEHRQENYEVLVLPGCSDSFQESDMPKPEPPKKSSIPTGDVYRWVKTTESQIPPNALVAGHDNYSKENVYIGRAHDSSQGLVPGKVVAFWKGFYYPLFGAERHLTQYEILVTDHPEMFKWVSASGSHVPNDAVVGGKTHDGASLYVARAKAPDGALTAGKLHPPAGCFVSWGGKEHRQQNYEVLVLPSTAGKQSEEKPLGNKVQPNVSKQPKATKTPPPKPVDKLSPPEKKDAKVPIRETAVEPTAPESGDIDDHPMEAIYQN